VLALAVALALYSRALSTLTPSGAAPEVVSDRELGDRLSALAELGGGLPPPAGRLGALVSKSPVECPRAPAEVPVTLVASYFERTRMAVSLLCFQGSELGAVLNELRARLSTSAVRGPLELEVVSGVQALPERHAWLDAFKLRPG